MLRNLQSLTFKRAYISVFQPSQFRAFAAGDKSNYERTKDQASQAWEKVKEKAGNITEDKGADTRGRWRESTESERKIYEKDLKQEKENLDNKFKDFEDLKAKVGRDPLMEGGLGEAPEKGVAGRVMEEAKEIGGKVSEKASEIGQKA